MALPTITDAKAILRIEHSIDDTLIQGMLDRACAFIVAYLGRPYEATEKTWVDEGGMIRAYGLLRSLQVPIGPIDPDTLEIVDADDVTLTVTTDYRAPQPWDAVVRAAVGTSFGNPPYTITADVGLSAAPDYTTVIEPVLSQAVLDCVQDWYQRRNPAAIAEGAGGGVMTQFNSGGLPPRVCAMLDTFKAPGVVA